MAQIAAEWEEIPEFLTLAKKLQEHFSGTPENVDHVNLDTVIAYKCTNKNKPEKKTKLYDMSGLSEPEAFLHPRKYFVKIFHDVWDNLDEVNRLAIVFSSLHRVDKENPESGKIQGFDMHDQAFMVRTLGADWQTRSDIPNLLTDKVEFRNEPIVS
ncbi:hypothetical protein LCGC14_2353160 [marine sediment metagenome]|uniref:Putative phage metallopeptidase domain-containing protein n=1 Tax=marine sediment metagenome TaxID=412755 RepID=A0A0F9C8H5_9ZZZZ